MNHKESENGKTTDAEIMTVVLLAAQYFAGNIEKVLYFARYYKPDVPNVCKELF
ncbi:MAG: hypothetical protein LBS20_17805 [Prevotella sp.]|nr:hypothetical protein [Prevotella sp.]